MQEVIEQEVRVPGASVFIGTSLWTAPENWTCPASSYVLCQRLSDGHPPLQLRVDRTARQEVYPRVRALGFMPSAGSITMQPLGQPLRTLNCWFDVDQFETATEMDASDWRALTGDFMPVASRNLEAMMQRMHHELTRPGFGSDQVIEAASTMIAIELARMAQRGARRSKSTGRETGGLAPWQLRRVRDRIAASLELGFPKAQELAELCGISRSHLMRMFRISTGWPLHRYVQEERLSVACRLLAEDRRSIKEIAAALGFSSAGHFTNAFERHQHVTPSEFRRRSLAGARLDHPMHQ